MDKDRLRVLGPILRAPHLRTGNNLSGDPQDSANAHTNHGENMRRNVCKIWKLETNVGDRAMHAVRNCVMCGGSTDLTDFSRGVRQWSVCQPDINAIAVASTLVTRTANSRAERILKLIVARRDENRDKKLEAGPGTTDQAIDGAQHAWEFVEEYDAAFGGT